ncbi:olfactory receptor 10R2 [Alligator mississippiensis]|uniref:Olfactory receptor n=1 Tax=Alligator mississippiensis TaxID=8496 RepID=A0A151NV69_ALLMI|nr:olfactory receptor 10R2 [Alligator mississippiensis]
MHQEAWGSRNQTPVREFILLGFSKFPEWQHLLFIVFLLLYLLILLGNAVIITLICRDRSLHTPMYFFLGVLSCSETCYTFVIIPKMLLNLMALSTTISLVGCATQMYFFLGFAVTNCLLLAVMGYDRYVAVCDPLHYTVIMNGRICLLLVAACCTGGFFVSLVGTCLVFVLPFCASRHVHHFFCDVSPVLKLACTDTHSHEIVIFGLGVLVLVIPLLSICASYACILVTVLHIPSATGRRKAFSTCIAHLTVVTVHYGCASFIYLRPTSSYASDSDTLVTVTYTIITPLLNPLVYSLRNKEVKATLWKAIGRRTFSHKS